jgi:hypothetical protein
MSTTKEDKYSNTEKLDMTPTWVGILPVYLAAFEDGNATGREAAKKELYRMAQLADKYAEIVKQQEAEGSTDRIKVIIPKNTGNSHMDDDAFTKYIEFLAGEMRSFPENIRQIKRIDDISDIESLSHYVPNRYSKDLTNEVDGINPNAVNDGHHLVIIPNNIRAIVANGSPLRIFIDKKDIKKFEKQLKPL